MSGGGGRILVVDDVPENVRLLEAVLASRIGRQAVRS
jgi:CheY-like chemotaxis protein